ncbi:MAG TPA: hypothetical protein VFS05_14660, partial [Gemmatimonadaceae bacterium]|nr:hypothetical protein [Gemmatimonadaceae bacterium]
AIVSFVRALLHDGAGSGFLDDLDGFVRRIAPAGWWNALARVVLHLASPGTPDVYQGNELWSHSLVDPDNRRPVDYALREKLLAELDAGADPAALLETAADGRIKLWVTSRTLRARRADAALWREGRYTPLHATGARAAHVVAFARELDGHAAIAVAPRLPWALGGATGRAPVGPEIWGDTAVALPPHLAGRRWTCALSGDNVESPLDAHGNSLRLADVCRVLPVALLQSSGTQVAH